MSEDVKARIREYWDLFNEHDADALAERVAEGAVNHNAAEGTADGPEGMRQAWGRLWCGFPDLRFELQDMLVDGNKVACIGMMSGTHEGEFTGIQPTGKSWRARHIHVLTLDDEGKMTEHLAVRDDVAMMQQLGLMPTAPA